MTVTSPMEGMRSTGSGMVWQQAGFLLARRVLPLEETSGPEGLRPTHSCDSQGLSESLTLTCAGMRGGIVGSLPGWMGRNMKAGHEEQMRLTEGSASMWAKTLDIGLYTGFSKH